MIMFPIIIALDNGCAHEDREPVFSLKGNVLSATEDSIKRLLDKNRKAINKWLLFGRAQLVATFEQTGEVIATGWYDYNSFSGHGEYQFQMER